MLDYKFMSIGSNCADLWYLGDKRLHGPIDNMVIKHTSALVSLFDGTFFHKIYTNPYIITTKTWSETTSDLGNDILEYSDFKIVHNNPMTDKFKAEFCNRIEKFKIFLDNIQDQKNWFVFNLNSYFVTEDHNPTVELLLLITFLKNKNILHKTIFVELKRTDSQIEAKWDAYLIDDSILPNKIVVENVTIADEAFRQFYQQFLLLADKES